MIPDKEDVWVRVQVLVALKYTGFGRDVVRPGQAVVRKEGEKFSCPERYGAPLANKGYLKILKVIKGM